MEQETKDNKAAPEEAAPQKQSSWLWLVAAIVLLVVAVWSGVYWNSTMKIEQVAFSGNSFVSDDKLRQVEVPLGLSPDSMNFVKIMEDFEQIPFVHRAALEVEPGGRLMVQIKERQPLAVLADGEDKIYVDGEGLRLPLVLGKKVDVPILYGFSAQPIGDTLKSDSFQQVARFLKELQHNPVSNATLSELVWTKDQGMVALTNQNGVKVIFGSGNFATRMRNWEAFYGEVIRKKGIESMRSVDLRFEGQIVARER